MIVEIRELKDKKLQNYIREMQFRKRLKRYYSEKKYIAYDTEELKELKKNVKMGRPPKQY